MISSRNCFMLIGLFFAMVFSLISVAEAKDPTVQEVINRHLDSISSEENRSKITNIITGGVSEFESKTPVVKGGGRTIIVSDEKNFYFSMSLNSNNYPFEKIGYFNGNVSLPFVMSGERSALGGFLNEHQQIVSDGLFGGALSVVWIRNIGNVQKLRMRMAGSKKIRDVKTWIIEVQSSAKGSGEFKARLYFDSETFQHIRSEYRREIPTGVIFNGRRNRFTDGYLLLTEDFSNFNTHEGVTLPSNYLITFSTDSPDIAYENSWNIKIVGARFNQQLSSDFFAF